jgi:hypothetical protein
MAFSYEPGGPQVGAARVMAMVLPGAAPAADIAILSDHARLPMLSERIAIADPAIVDATVRAGGLAGVTVDGHGGMQRDRGRFSI